MIKHPLQIGSILYTSWGYEQTNIDFYQVIELIGTSTVVLREIAQEKIWLAMDSVRNRESQR